MNQKLHVSLNVQQLNQQAKPMFHLARFLIMMIDNESNYKLGVADDVERATWISIPILNKSSKLSAAKLETWWHCNFQQHRQFMAVVELGNPAIFSTLRLSEMRNLETERKDNLVSFTVEKDSKKIRWRIFL